MEGGQSLSPTCVYLYVYIIVSVTLFMHLDNVDHSHFVHITSELKRV